MSLLTQFIHRPQPLRVRKALFQVHLWVGLGVGLYLFVIGVTGASIVFIEEMEHALFGHFHHVADPSGPPAPLPVILRDAAAAYPDHRLVSVYPPTPERETWVAYLLKDRKYMAAFLHPVTAKPIGEVRAAESWLHWLQDLHVNLLSGVPGRIVNGVGALFLLTLCVTGAVIWWPGRKNWRRGTRVDFRRSGKRINWDLHSATGFWTLALLGIWAVSGVYFAFPKQFRAAVNTVSAVSYLGPPQSDPKGKGPAPTPEILVARGGDESPGSRFGGLVLPATETSPWLVLMMREDPEDFDNADYVYFDRYSGERLMKWQRGISQSAGDVFMKWIVLLHFGTFGGVWSKALWVVLGLAPSVLFVTGSVMWWNRVLSKKWRRLKEGEPLGRAEDVLEAPAERQA